jgi:hypothetical protein
MVGRTPDWSAHGIVEASPDKVARILLRVHPGPASRDNGLVLMAGDLSQLGRAVISGSPPRFTAKIGGPDAATSVSVEVDPDGQSVTVEGHWWYRGTYSVKPHQQGSQVSYDVYNIAAGGTRWLARLTNLQQSSKTTETLRQVLRLVGDELGCRAALVEE